MKKWEIEYSITDTGWKPDKKENEYITETAGFIPLEVKFKRFEQAGIAAQFNSSEFTSADYREMYLNPDFNITPEDELEEVQEKLQMQYDFMNKLAKQKKAVSVEPDKPDKEKAGTQEPKEEDKKTAQSAE